MTARRRAPDPVPSSPWAELPAGDVQAVAAAAAARAAIVAAAESLAVPLHELDGRTDRLTDGARRAQVLAALRTQVGIELAAGRVRTWAAIRSELDRLLGRVDPSLVTAGGLAGIDDEQWVRDVLCDLAPQHRMRGREIDRERSEREARRRGAVARGAEIARLLDVIRGGQSDDVRLVACTELELCAPGEHGDTIAECRDRIARNAAMLAERERQAHVAQVERWKAIDAEGRAKVARAAELGGAE